MCRAMPDFDEELGDETYGYSDESESENNVDIVNDDGTDGSVLGGSFESDCEPGSEMINMCIFCPKMRNKLFF